MKSDEHHIRPAAMRVMKRYPGLFGPGPWTRTTSPMAWGFSCSEGWYPILERLFQDLDCIREEDGLHDIQVVQVKEKLGGLRVYVQRGNARIHARIKEAANEALVTCERCGGPSGGIRSHGGWRSNACDDCLKRLARERSGA